MTNGPVGNDLVILVADQNIKVVTDGLLSRHHSLRIRPVRFGTFVHPEHDPGCLRRAHGFLRSFASEYDYALVVFDREGCGKEGASAQELEAEVETALARSGWEDRAATIVLDPELEAWVWSDSPHVDRILGWAGRTPNLRTWLVGERFLQEGEFKPARPKEAMERALREVRRP